MSSEQRQTSGRSTRWIPWGLGAVALLAVLATVAGPGITVDEPLDVRPGRNYVATLLKQGWRSLQPDLVAQVYADNAEHPPLGRWLLGIASSVFEPVEVLWKGPDPTGTYVLAGRVAPAVCFALLVTLVSRAAGRWGNAAAASAGLALLLSPRAFGHAHLGALDTFLCLFWTLALLSLERAGRVPRPLLATILAGLCWSLALLTKIHAWFLPLFALPLFLARFSIRKALALTGLWLGVGLAGFFAGWPWLWFDSKARLLAYLGTGVDRTPILVEYLGRVLQDRNVPWHYPIVYFLLTTPLGFLLLGFAGIGSTLARDSARTLGRAAMAVVAFFLALFACLSPVYDQDRLFLVVVPFWAILVGLGFQRFWTRFQSRAARGLACLLLAGQGVGIATTHPFELSYYNSLLGPASLRTAVRLGLEPTYWNDAVDPALLDRLAQAAPAGARPALVPSLYPGQGIFTTSRSLVQKDIILADQEAAGSAEWVVVSRRTAYWPRAFQDRLASGAGRMVFANERQGVWLAGVWRFPPSPQEFKEFRPGSH